MSDAHWHHVWALEYSSNHFLYLHCLNKNIKISSPLPNNILNFVCRGLNFVCLEYFRLARQKMLSANEINNVIRLLWFVHNLAFWYSVSNSESIFVISTGTRRSRHTNVWFVDVTASRFSFMNDFQSTTLPSRVRWQLSYVGEIRTQNRPPCPGARVFSFDKTKNALGKRNK